MMVVSVDGTMVVVNRAAGTLFGYEIEELVGKPVEILISPGLRKHHRRFRATFADDPGIRPMGAERDLIALTRNGSEIPVEVGLNPVDTPSGPLVICSVVDLTARKRTEQDLAEVAGNLGLKNKTLLEMVATDGLTSLKNRRAFLDHMATQVEISVRQARPLSVLILDIDHFKRFNDDYGHLAGDAVLRQVGKILQEVARRSDLVARIGGEEFGIILPDTDSQGARVLGERFRGAIEAATWPNRGVTASLGAMTLNPEHAVPRPEAPEVSFLMGRADRALYRSKALGRNRVTHVEDMEGER
jgi:diguanylate cyclase (GGDEF)-like protein/PAS domain S-box-containing protein